MERSVRSLEKLAEDHFRRAEEMRTNPSVRPGMEERSAQEIAMQQQRRFEKLRRDAEEFQRQADQIEKRIRELEREF